MPRVVFVGAATCDVIALADHHPAADERMVAERVGHAGGGPAATAAVAAARLGLPVELVATVGADAPGREVAAGLATEGVGTRHLRVDPGGRTQVSLVICSRRDASRAICTSPVPPLALSAAAADAVLAADWVHVDHLGWPAVARLLAEVPRGRWPKVSVDAGNPVADPGCRPADVHLYAPTLDGLRARFGRRDVPDLLAACGAPLVVATAGAEGSVARDPGGTVHRVAGFPVDVVSTLGAGDVFHGALVAALVRDLPLRRAMGYAGIAAALSCRALDGRSAIPGPGEVVSRLDGCPGFR